MKNNIVAKKEQWMVGSAFYSQPFEDISPIDAKGGNYDLRF
jgi:hypothetical protein